MAILFPPYPSASALYCQALAGAAGTVGLLMAFLGSNLRFRVIAMREDPEAAESIGISLVRNKLAVYSVSAMISTLAGALFFMNKGMVYPESGFSTGWTISAVFICTIGGAGTVFGPVVGAVIYVLLRETLAHYPGWSNLILGTITIFVILHFPKGILGQDIRSYPLVRRFLGGIQWKRNQT